MTLDPLLFFPLAAFALVVFYPILDRGSNAAGATLRSSRRRRRIVLRRTAVVVLPLAAALSAVWPLWPEPRFGPALQALLICVIVLLPLFIAHVVISRRYDRKRAGNLSRDDQKKPTPAPRPVMQNAALADENPGDGPSGSRSSDTTPAAASRKKTSPAASSPRTPRPPSATSAPEEEDTERARSDQAQPGQTQPGRTQPEQARQSEQTRPDPSRSVHAEFVQARETVQAEPDSTTGDILPLSTADDDSGSTTDAQLARLTELIDSFDLGENDAAEIPSGGTRSLLTRAPVDEKALRSTARELSRMDGGEIISLVNTLRGDQTRLQKLVIAQRAAHASEREAHERTRTLARDAMQMMRSARESQKIAEKLARRERRQRLNIEEKYQRVTRALDNAISIIDTHRQDDPGDTDGRGKGGTSDTGTSDTGTSTTERTVGA